MSTAWALPHARGRGWLERLDPRLKLAWLAWVSAMALLVDSTAALVALFTAAALPAAGLGLRPRGWLLLCGLLLLVAWSTMLSQGLFYAYVPRSALVTLVPRVELAGWVFPGLKLYREGLAHGLAQSLRMLSVTVTGLAVCLSTSPQLLLAALVRLRVSVALGFVVVAALRFLPSLLAEAATVRRAMRLRGYRPALFSTPCVWRTWPRAVRMELAVLRPLLASSLRRAAVLAASVTSRGFDPDARRTFYPPLRFRAGERLALCLLALSALLAAGAKLLYGLYLGGLFYQPWLRPLYAAVRRWL